MRSKKSYAVWLRLICVVLAVSLPVALALRGAWMLGFRAVAQERSEIEQFRAQDLRTQSRSLSDLLWNTLHEIEIQSRAIDSVGKFPKVTVPSIARGSPTNRTSYVTDGLDDSTPLLVAEVSPSDLVVQKVISNNEFNTAMTAANSAFFANVRTDLSNAAKLISKAEIQKTGVSLVPFGVDHKYLAIAFASNDLPTRVNVSPGMPVAPLLGKYLFAVVNPARAFQNITKWSSGKEGEPLRGYLIGADGRVLVHSTDAFNSADFSTSAFFRQALQPTFRGERTGGTGIFPAADSFNTRVSYIAFHSLPFVVVAERVVRPNSVHFLRLLAGPAVLWGSVLILTCLASIILILQVLAPAEEKDAILPGFVEPDMGRSLNGAINQLAEIQSLRASKQKLGDEIRKLRQLQKFENDASYSAKVSQAFENEIKSAEERATAQKKILNSATQNPRVATPPKIV